MKLIFATALLTVALAAPAAAQAIGGTYSVNGTNLDGSRYGGTAQITLTSQTTCVIEWHTGGTTSSGICSRNGDSFAAAYELNGDIGLVIYKVGRNGTMNGLWTVAGQDGGGTEVLTPR